MQLNMHEVVAFARIIKAADNDDKKRRKKRKSLNPIFTGAYPDFGKSIVTQHREDPHAAGVRRGVGTGITGAILGALLARLISKDLRLVAGGAVGGGLLGGIPGYVSGAQEAKSNYTKLLALRRLGINTPAEYEQALTFPSVTERLTAPGVRI